MKPWTRSARALRAAPILVLAFLMAGAGASPAPAPATVVTNPHAAQVLAAATAAPAREAARTNVDAATLPAPDRSSRRVAELAANATAEAAAEARAKARAEATAEAKAKAEARAEARARAQAKASRENAPRSSKPDGRDKPDRNDQSPKFGGSNHFWMPSLGLDYRVHTYACSRSDPLANVLYRWGCAGNNNLYLMGHAWGVMDGLHDAYVRGNLSVGMTATYANGNGQLATFRVTEWRVVHPSNSSWAIAAQSRPSMTLQTCVGRNGQNRLVVRLVAVN